MRLDTEYLGWPARARARKASPAYANQGMGARGAERAGTKEKRSFRDKREHNGMKRRPV